MGGNLPKIITGSVRDFVLKDFFALPSRWQFRSVDTLVLQRQVPCLQVDPYAQVSLVLFEDVLQGLCCQALLAYVRKASLWVSPKFSGIVTVFGAVYSLSIDNQVQAVVGRISCFYKSEFDVVIVRVHVSKAEASRPKKHNPKS